MSTKGGRQSTEGITVRCEHWHSHASGPHALPPSFFRMVHSSHGHTCSVFVCLQVGRHPVLLLYHKTRQQPRPGRKTSTFQSRSQGYLCFPVCKVQVKSSVIPKSSSNYFPPGHPAPTFIIRQIHSQLHTFKHLHLVDFSGDTTKRRNRRLTSSSYKHIYKHVQVLVHSERLLVSLMNCLETRYETGVVIWCKKKPNGSRIKDHSDFFFLASIISFCTAKHS